MFRGALHLHSTYSDGEFTLAELRVALRATGCRFACITDHADWFDAPRLEAYVRECRMRSDADFLFIPGLEYSCANRMHILGYGVATPVDSDDPEHVIAEIKRLGGLAVVAHPKNDAFETIEQFDPLPDGLEVWNTKYDGQYAPRPGTFALLARLRTRRSDLQAFYGLDLHWRNQHRRLFVDVVSETLDADGVLSALRRGAYTATKDGLRLPSTGVLPAALLARFERANAWSRRMRRALGALKSIADRAGLGVPAVVKAKLRRIF
jgi:predicted metal-dependent phosphoesterase TrpH